MIKVRYSKVNGRCMLREPLTSGMVGQPIHFEYSHDFDGLAITAVFTDGKNTVNVVNPGSECVIPHEVLTTVGATVKVGIYAVRGDELVIPTIYAHIGIVLKGADPSGDVSADPSLPVWAQTQALIGNLSQIETETKDSLVAAINEVKQTADRKANAADLAPVATSGSYNDLTNKPTIPTVLPNPHKLTINGTEYDGSTDVQMTIEGGGGSVPKPLTYDYMPEGYPTKTMGTVTVMEEQVVEFVSPGDGSPSIGTPTTTFTPVEGQTYIVNWDGAEHECVCSIFKGRLLVLGNLSIVGAGDDTGEPFIYLNLPSMASEFETLDTSPSHTISVKRIDETVTPIDAKFLPKSVFTDADWDFVSNRPIFNKPLNINITAENIVESINIGDNYVDLGATVPDFNEGLYYKVEGEVAFLNNSADVSYPLQINGYYKANSRAEISLGTVYDGYSRNNLKVSLYGNNSISSYMGRLCVNSGEGPRSYTITANFTIISEVKQLSEDYIPNTIQRVGDDIILSSSTAGSTKKYKITVDDTGTLSATEVT